MATSNSELQPLSQEKRNLKTQPTQGTSNLYEIYNENNQLRAQVEYLTPCAASVDVDNGSTTVLDRLEQLQGDQQVIKHDRKESKSSYKEIFLILHRTQEGLLSGGRMCSEVKRSKPTQEKCSYEDFMKTELPGPKMRRTGNCCTGASEIIESMFPWEPQEMLHHKHKTLRRAQISQIVGLIMSGCVVLVCLTTVILNSDVLKAHHSTEPDTAQVPALLLQALPIGQGLQQSFDSDDKIPLPLRKYYLNIGMRNDYLLQECQGPQLKRSFPDVDYALLGYNILKGYPLAVGHDPGFTLPIFSADYRAGSQTADCRYSIPKGIILIPDVSCVTSFTSEVVETKYEFSKSLAVSASVSGGGWGVSFSASAGYKESSSQVSTGESVFILSKASCNYYYMRLLEDDAPPFHPVFLKWIIKLNNSHQDSDFVDFFDKYGTHFLKEVKFGASFTYLHKMSSSSFKEEKEKGVNVAVSASYSGLFSVGGGFSMDSSEKEAASNFQKKVETRTITIGAAPPANGDAMTWASSVKESPVPVYYDLSPIEDIFSKTFMTGPQIDRYKINYRAIADKITSMKGNYCNVLKANGLLDSCADLSAGLNMENTFLSGWFDKVVLTTIGKCIDECVKRTNCIAIDFCVKCTTKDSQYNACYMFDEVKQKSGYNNDKWKTTIIIPEIQRQLVFANTSITGIERTLNNESSVTTEKQCFAACLDDLYCVAFTFCACPHKDKKCNLYGESYLSLLKEEGTSTHFISRHLRDVNLVYPTTTTTTTTTTIQTTTTTTSAKRIRN